MDDEQNRMLYTKANTPKAMTRDEALKEKQEHKKILDRIHKEAENRKKKANNNTN